MIAIHRDQRGHAIGGIDAVPLHLMKALPSKLAGALRVATVPLV
jgi:hypothetical protein